MPYIKQDRRDTLQVTFLDPTAKIETVGELNYMLTKLIQFYAGEKGTSYQTINDIVGALEGAKLEFYRRVASPYEDEKIKENGDVY